MRILVLEDDPITAMDIEALIERDVKAEIIICGSVADATGHINRHPFDFAFLDIDVRDGKSFGVAEVLADTHTPFAFVSGSRPDEVPLALKSVPFVAKPFSPQALFAALELARARSMAAFG